jgi:hypothetical protein
MTEVRLTVYELRQCRVGEQEALPLLAFLPVTTFPLYNLSRCCTYSYAPLILLLHPVQPLLLAGELSSSLPILISSRRNEGHGGIPLACGGHGASIADVINPTDYLKRILCLFHTSLLSCVSRFSNRRLITDGGRTWTG